MDIVLFQKVALPQGLLSDLILFLQDQGFGGNRRDDTWDKVGQIRDKFEYDRERRMTDKGLCIYPLSIFYIFLLLFLICYIGASLHIWELFSSVCFLIKHVFFLFKF